MKKDKSTHTVCAQACRFLHISLSLTILQLFIITLQLLHTDGSPTHLYAIQLYRGMLEYIMLDITIAVVGGFLIDITVKE